MPENNTYKIVEIAGTSPDGVTEAMRAGEQRTMPKRKDDRAGDFDADGNAGGVDVFVTECGAEQAYEQRRKRWDDGERNALLERVSHKLECTSR